MSFFPERIASLKVTDLGEVYKIRVVVDNMITAESTPKAKL